MKRLKHLVFLILLMFPLFVNAELRDYKLQIQTNSEVYNSYNHSEIYQFENSYFIDGYVEHGAVDFNGNVLFSERKETSFSATDGKYIYYPIDSSIEYESGTGIIRIDIKTGEKKSYEIECISSNCYAYLNIYANEDGIIYGTRDNGESVYYRVNYEMTSHEIVTTIDSYNSYDNSKEYIVSREAAENIKEYLSTKVGITITENNVSEIVEYKNQYFVAIEEENLVKLYYLNKELTEHSYIIISEFLGANYVNSFEIFVQNDGVVVWLMAGKTYCPMSNISYNKCGPAYIMQKYVPYFNVTEKTDGNGTIVIAKPTADSGEEVTFTVEPKEGYVLDEVKVTDANGNVVVFTDYTFTMPSADVTIEATFIKEVDNSETSDSTIMMFIATMSILIFIAANYKRKVLE